MQAPKYYYTTRDLLMMAALAALGIDTDLDEIKNGRNVRFDPDVVDVCIKIFKKNKFKFK